MNKQAFFALFFAIFAMSATAHAAYQSQTIIRFTDGMIDTPAMTADTYNIFTPGVKDPFTVTNAGLLYDKRNPLPSLMMVGSNYAFFKGGVMATVDENGGFWYKGKVTVEPAALGGNFFLNKGTNEVIAIDSAGFYNSTGVMANSVRLMGGNFYIDQAGLLTTIKHMGAAPGNPLGMVTTKDGWNFSNAIIAGGNWFEQVDGSVNTINSETGFFSDKAYTPDSRPAKIGGNYFVGEDGYLYTVSSIGELKKNMPVLGDITTYGYSYMISDDGYFIFVDGKGVPHTELVRVSTTGIKAELVKKITGALDTHQNFTQAIQ